MAVTLDDLRNMRPGYLNPDLVPKSGTPIARPDNITDNPMAVTRRTFRNVLEPNVFEGVSTFKGVVLQVQGANAQSTTQTSDSDRYLYRCMIPELDMGKPNPFSVNDRSRYSQICNYFYSTPFYSVKSLAVNEAPAPVGSIVHIRFQDPNRAVGYVVGVEEPGNFNLNEIGTLRAREAHGAAQAPGPPPTSYPESTREAFDGRTADKEKYTTEITEAFGINLKDAEAIYEAAANLGIDPAHLANAVNAETRMDPSSQNPEHCADAGVVPCAVGVIQFVGSTLDEMNAQNGTTYTQKQIAGMSIEEQMPLVQQYFELPRIKDKFTMGQQPSQSDVHMAIFHPPAIGAGPDYPIYDDWVEKHGTEEANSISARNYDIYFANDYYHLLNQHRAIEP